MLLSRFSRVRFCATPEMAAHQAPPSLGFSRQEHWSGFPFPSPIKIFGCFINFDFKYDKNEICSLHYSSPICVLSSAQKIVHLHLLTCDLLNVARSKCVSPTHWYYVCASNSMGYIRMTTSKLYVPLQVPTSDPAVFTLSQSQHTSFEGFSFQYGSRVRRHIFFSS